MLSPPNFILLSAQDKDALIVQLLTRLEALERENAALREKLNLPAKRPDNSSTPPAAGAQSNGETTHRPNRSRAVVEQFLGEHRPDFWVSDRLAAQMNWARKDHQVCLAHLIRDAQYAIDAGDTAFAPGLRKLLRRACKIGGRRHKLADVTLRAYAYKLDTELDVLLRIAPDHGAGNKLQNVIKGCRRHMFVFLANRAIPPTNNGSEQALRPCVIFRKVTNCFRSEWAAHLYADIRSSQ